MTTATFAQKKAVLRARSAEMRDRRVAHAVYAENAHTRDGGDDQAATRYAAIVHRFEVAYCTSVTRFLRKAGEDAGPATVTEGLYKIHAAYWSH
jgi:hypothetical protein